MSLQSHSYIQASGLVTVDNSTASDDVIESEGAGTRLYIQYGYVIVTLAATGGGGVVSIRS
jgi:hypothetical protein